MLFPTASVNTSAATSIVVAPSEDGVNVAVYTVELIDEKLLNAPPSTVMSPAAKFVVASLDVKVSAMVESFVVEPSVTPLVVLAIVIVGLVVSAEKLLRVLDI